MQKLKYINSSQFFKDYLPDIKSVRHKIRGKNGRGNPTKFSQTEEKQINQAILKMARNAVKK